MIWRQEKGHTPARSLQILITGVIAISLTVGLNLALGEIDIKNDSALQSLIIDYSHAFSTDLITSSIEAVFLWMMLMKMVCKGVKKRFLYWWMPFSIFIAFCYIFSKEFYENNTWNLMFANAGTTIRALIVISSHAIVIFILLYAGYISYQRFCKIVNMNDSETAELRILKPISVFFIIFACWIPYYIVFFPGNTFQDSITQLMQAFHLPTMTAGITLTDGVNTVYSDHHPVFLTLLYGAFARLGIMINGNIKLGIGLYTLTQMIVMATALTVSVRLAGKMGMPLRMQKFLVIVYSICPFFALNSVGIVKDINLSIAVLVVTELLLYAVYKKGKCFQSIKYSLILFTGLLLMMLCKKTGVYIAAISMAFFCIQYRKKIVSTMLPFLTSILVFSIGISSVITSALNVQSSGKQEMLGLLFQQTARYVRDCSEDVTEQEKDTIDRILDYNSLGELYNPKVSDPVKATFKQTAGIQEIKDYFKVYILQFQRHPGVYLQAFFSNISVFFYLDGLNMQGYTSWINISDCRKEFLEKHGIYEEEYKELEISKAEWQKKIAAIYSECMTLLEKIPIVGFFFRKAGIIYLTIGLLFMMLYKRDEMVLGFIPVVVSFLLLFVAPVADMRYVYPLAINLPMLITTGLKQRS